MYVSYTFSKRLPRTPEDKYENTVRKTGIPAKNRTWGLSNTNQERLSVMVTAFLGDVSQYYIFFKYKNENFWQLHEIMKPSEALN
jgi:hypothetical protein